MTRPRCGRSFSGIGFWRASSSRITTKQRISSSTSSPYFDREELRLGIFASGSLRILRMKLTVRYDEPDKPVPCLNSQYLEQGRRVHK